MKKIPLKSISKQVNQAVTEYIEGKIGVKSLAARVGHLDNADIYSALSKAGKNELIMIIVKAADIDWETSQPGYNPKDKYSVQSVLENYYKKLSYQP